MKLLLSFFVLTAATVLHAVEISSAPETTFRIFPGNWNKRCLKDKNLSKLIRFGIDPVSGKSDGKLSDKDPRRSAVSFNYHGIPLKQRVLTIEADLGKKKNISRLQLNAFRNNDLYDIKEVIFYGSTDGLVWQHLGECSGNALKLKNYLYTAKLNGSWQNLSRIRFSVISGNTWINITEISIDGTPSETLPEKYTVTEKTLNVKPAAAGKIPVFFLKTRLNLPEGEEIGKYLLKLDFSGSQEAFLLNRQKELTDSQSGKTLPLQDKDGAFLVRADADYHPFNAPAGHPYDSTMQLNRAFASELANRFYHYTFRLNGKGGKVTLSARIPTGFALDIADFCIREMNAQFFYCRDWMQAIMPDTFPMLEEIEKSPGFQIAGNETGLTASHFYTFLPVKGKLELTMPDGKAELFEIRDTPVQHTRKFAAENALPNLGKALLPEWWVPETGKLREFPAGSTGLAIRFTPDKNAVTGPRQGKLQLRADNGNIVASTTINYEILPFKLPEYSSLPASFGLYIMGSGTSNVKDDFWYDIADHGIGLTFMTPWGTPVKLALDNGKKLTADFSLFNRRLKEHHRFRINSRMVFFGTAEPLIAQIKKITGKNPGDPEFNRRFKEFIALFAANSEKLGIPVRLSLYDEANFKPEDWKKTTLLTKLAKEVPGSRMWITSTTNGAAYAMYRELGYRKNEDMVLTHPSKMLEQSDDLMLPSVDKRKFASIAEIKNFHLRAEYNDVFAFPGENARYDFGLRTYRSNLEVFFAFAYWWGKLDKPNFTPTRRHYISIPFAAEPGGTLCTTSGWEAVRTGIDDYRYLILAQDILSKKHGAENARSELVKLIKSDSPRPDLFTPDHYGKLRNALINIIKETK